VTFFQHDGIQNLQTLQIANEQEIRKWNWKKKKKKTNPQQSEKEMKNYKVICEEHTNT
jgi:hypothetical protein